MSSCNVVRDYTARPEIKEPLSEQSDQYKYKYKYNTRHFYSAAYTYSDQ